MNTHTHARLKTALFAALALILLLGGITFVPGVVFAEGRLRQERPTVPIIRPTFEPPADDDGNGAKNAENTPTPIPVTETAVATPPAPTPEPTAEPLPTLAAGIVEIPTPQALPTAGGEGEGAALLAVVGAAALALGLQARRAARR